MSRVVFVYGTLRLGERNHHMMGACVPLGAGQTEPRYDLVDLGDHPAMISGGCTAVVGEVYSMDEHTLAQLDALEDHPEYYQRTPIRLTDGRDVFAYLLPRALAEGAPLIPSGDWRRRPPP